MKTVLITGATGGIGCGIAESFYHNGYHLILHYHKNQTKIDELLECYPGSSAIKADLTKEEEVLSMMDTLKTQGHTIDVLVNNAGISQKKLLIDTTLEDWNHLFAHNMTSAFLLTREVLKEMIPQKSGAIINVSSVWGLKGASLESAYSATKAALIGFTKALAEEYGPSGITVNAVAPGVIDTAMNHDLASEDIEKLKEATPAGRLGTAKDVGKAVLFLSEQPFITGEIVNISGGFVV